MTAALDVPRPLLEHATAAAPADPRSPLARHNVRATGPADAPALVFAHGFGCDQSVWQAILPRVASDRRIVLYDLAGAGESPAETYSRRRHATLAGHADDLLAVCDAAGLGRVTFVGHSVSATIGMLAAARAPERFERLVLVGPNPCYIDEGDYRGGFSRADIDGLLDMLDENWFAWARMMAPVVMGTPDAPELGDALANCFCRFDPAIARHFGRVTFLSDHRGDCARVRVPTTVLQCRDDALAPVAVGQWLARALPQGEMRLLDARGRCPHLSAPAELAQHLQDILAGAR